MPSGVVHLEVGLYCPTILPLYYSALLFTGAPMPLGVAQLEAGLYFSTTQQLYYSALLLYRGADAVGGAQPVGGLYAAARDAAGRAAHPGRAEQQERAQRGAGGRGNGTGRPAGAQILATCRRSASGHPPGGRVVWMGVVGMGVVGIGGVSECAPSAARQRSPRRRRRLRQRHESGRDRKSAQLLPRSLHPTTPLLFTGRTLRVS